MHAIIEYGVKGKSGHWGHAGIQGHRGGSKRPGAAVAPTLAQISSDPKNIIDSKPLGGGVTHSRKLEYRTIGPAVWKPLKEHASFHSGNAEVNGYRLAHLMAGGDPDLEIVPETAYADDENGIHGTAQAYIPGATTASVKMTEIGTFQQRKLVEWGVKQDPVNADREVMLDLLDQLINNGDRHEGNYLYDANNRLWAIDHGHSAWNPSNFKYGIPNSIHLQTVEKLRNGNAWLSPRLLRAAKKWKTIDKVALSNLLLDDQRAPADTRPVWAEADMLWRNLQVVADTIIKANTP